MAVDFLCFSKSSYGALKINYGGLVSNECYQVRGKHSGPESFLSMVQRCKKPWKMAQEPTSVSCTLFAI